VVDISKFANTPFFSTVLKALEKVPQRVMPAKELDALLLKYGAKPKELKYVRENKVASSRPERVEPGNFTGDERISLLSTGLPKVSEKTKKDVIQGDYDEEVVDAILGRNYERFRELTGDHLDDYMSNHHSRLVDMADENGEDLSDVMANLDRGYETARVRRHYSPSYVEGQPKYSEYTTEGKVYPADNYNELIVNARDPGARNYYYSSHWDDTQDPLYHLRYKDMDLPSGKRGLFIEELQSDWNQEGRKKGYWPSSQKKGDVVYDLSRELNGRITPERMEELENQISRIGSSVPTNPLMDTNDWVDSALRRSIYEAASRGHDRVGWTDAMTQGKRWNAVREERPSWNDDPEWNELMRQRDLVRVQLLDPTLSARSEEFGRLADLKNSLQKKMTGIEERYVSMPLQPVVLDNARYLGMNKFYDEIVPSRMNKLISKYGGTVENPQKHAWEARIPDELLARYLAEGIPFFKDGGKVKADPHDFSNRYNTELTPAEEQQFLAWAGDRARDVYDYDLRGFWKSGEAFAENGHGSDRYKKPNHPTFSDQSIYNGREGAVGGKWVDMGDGTWEFVATPTNLQYHDESDLLRYFDEVEHGNRLSLPLGHR
jgi:hypothetical protein